MRKKQKIDSLVHLAGLRFRAAQSELAAILEKEAGLRRNIEQLMQSKSELAQAKRRSDDPARVAGADIRWNHWADQRRATINTELAQVLASKGHYEAAVKYAFGRDQVARSLQDQVANTARLASRRKADYES